MRRHIDLVEELVFEQGKLKVYYNPSKDEFLHALNTSEHGALRALIDRYGDLFVWDAEQGLHSDIDDLGFDTGSSINFTIWFNHVDSQGNNKSKLRAAMKANEMLVELGVTKMRIT